MINDTKNIPEAVIGRVYTPRTSEYEVACDQFDLYAFNASNLLLSNSGCTVAQYLPLGGNNIDFNKARVVNLSKVKNFRNVSTAVFGEYGDLLQAMEASIKNTTATSNSTLFMELKVHGSFIEAVVCSSFEYPDPGVISMSCIYNNVNMFILKQQEINNLIVKARGGRTFPYPPVTSIAMTIEHIVALHNGVPQPVSMSTMKNVTYEAAQYLASLGQNFYPDYAEEQLYVLFDTTDPRQGFKIPEWLLISMAATMIVCFCLWAMTKVLLGVRYTSSLYKVVSMQLSPHTEISAPMLIRSKFEPFEFEDIPVVPVNDLYESDASKTKTSLKHFH
ncbi:hypothetical protein BGX23_002573 [Mortierella sp. AD031]|nr:hypothetical protein BGX23_002573 [Mortierella sp. AD031]